MSWYDCIDDVSPLRSVFVIRYDYRRTPPDYYSYAFFDGDYDELSEAQLRKKYIFRHWVRPKFLQYKYLYNYQKNYYDDMINYLDKRNRGIYLEKPRAQTWAERALRTYTNDLERSTYLKSFGIRLNQENRFRKNYVNLYHADHSNNYYQHKYKSVLY